MANLWLLIQRVMISSLLILAMNLTKLFKLVKVFFWFLSGCWKKGKCFSVQTWDFCRNISPATRRRPHHIQQSNTAANKFIQIQTADTNPTLSLSRNITRTVWRTGTGSTLSMRTIQVGSQTQLSSVCFFKTNWLIVVSFDSIKWCNSCQCPWLSEVPEARHARRCQSKSSDRCP